MKTTPTLSLLSATLLASILTCGVAQAASDTWPALTASHTDPLAPSFGTARSVVSADSTVKITVNPDGSLSQSRLTTPRDQIVAFHVDNASNQPVRIAIEGEGAEPVRIGEVAAGKPADFAWRFDSWKAEPKALKVGQSAVKLFVTLPSNTN